MGAKELRIGVIGCGEIVRAAHVPAHRHVGVKAVAAYDPDERALAAFCELSPGTYRAASLDQLFGDPRIQAVDIAIPPDQQYRVATRRQPVKADFVLEGDPGTVFGRIGLWDRYPLPAPDSIWFQGEQDASARLLRDQSAGSQMHLGIRSANWLQPFTAVAPPTVDGQAAVRRLEIVEAIYRSSSRGGNWIAV